MALPSGNSCVAPDHTVLQYLLGTVNIPEASYEDNSRLIIEWLRQLKLGGIESQKKIGLDQVMAWVGDQLTVDRLRNLFKFRAEDDNSFERLDWLVVPPGFLHISMAFANSIHKQHLGTSKGRGLLAAVDLLGRKGLHSSKTEGPFFHDLNETLHIIADAQIRELWLQFGLNLLWVQPECYLARKHPWYPLLRSNDAPLAPQKLLVEEILRDKRAELFPLGDEIAQLERTLWSLRKKHADLGAEVTQYSSILSPIRNVPPEYIPTSPTASPFTKWSSLEISSHLPAVEVDFSIPWPIVARSWISDHCGLTRSHGLWHAPGTKNSLNYCRSLRISAKAIPFLPFPSREVHSPWYYEALRAEEAEAFEIATTLDFIDGYLQRFGNRPLSFRFWPREFAVPTLWAALLKHSARWQEIVFVDPSPALLEQCSVEFRGGLQGLCQIGIVSTERSAIQLDFLYRLAPNLTDLTLMEITIRPVNGRCIPWNQLTRYCEIGCDWLVGNGGRLWSYRKLTNLRILRMKLSEYRFLETGTPLILPNLRAAILDFLLCTHSHTTELMQSFDMPALEDLTIRYGALVDPLRFLVLRSSPKLKYLRAHAHTSFPYADPDHLVRILELFPGLEEIIIDIPHLITNTDVSRLIPSPHQLPLLGPKLGTIWFSNRSFVDGSCEWRTLANMLQARFQPTVPGITRLQTFKFFTEKFSNDAIVTSGLKTLRVRNDWDIRVGDKCSLPSWEPDF
ncbi:hypothetical protein B0H14DRAFT_3161922 [Mycena olivaceomarginata]|nr:hypothetical protein B0H14DRAFT_3161922 [Mycena olivaceomarginata]